MDIIDIDAVRLPSLKREVSSSQSNLGRTILSWLSAWEIYPLIAAAIFLHFYGLTTTQFDADQAILFRLPRAAVVHGLIPATGTIASINMVNPPGYVYLLMPIAAFTANPLSVVIFTILLNILAIILTYVFTRNYYGRVAATIAALLYATTFQDIFFGRFIWQPNLLPFFTILFMFALFRGVVKRKSGWFAVALPLLGFMLQLHATPLYLGIPLAITLALAYKTIRKRDLAIGLGLFCLMFSTYIIWEISTHFVDIQTLLGASHNPAHFDEQALQYYLDFIIPDTPFMNNAQHDLLNAVPLLHWTDLTKLVKWAIYIAFLGGFLVAGLGLLGWERIQLMSHSRFPAGEARPTTESSISRWQRLWRWWNTFAASPQRCGLLLLLAWQLPPLLLISRHTIPLQPQYFLFFLPGPFIFIGLFFSQVSSWCGEMKAPVRLLRFVVPALSILLIAVQFTASFAWFFGEIHSDNAHTLSYDTLQDMQGAIDASDHLAQTRHLRHVYIDTDIYTYETLKYLASQMQTPATVLSSSHCLVLPSLAQGPAVMLFGPADTLDEALLTHFASTTLVSEPPRLGGAPFHLYIVQPLSATPDSQSTFTGILRPNSKQPGTFTWNDPAVPNGLTSRVVETRWTNLKSLPNAYGTMYTYHFAAQYAGNGVDGTTGSADCSFTNLAPGAQLLVPFQLPAGSSASPTSLTLSGSSSLSQPDQLNYGPFHFESILDQSTTPVPFQSSTAGENIVLQN